MERQPLCEFEQAPAAAVHSVRETGEPLLLTVDDSPAVVVMDAEAYRTMRKLAREAEQAEMIAFLHASLADLRAGRVVPAREAIEEIMDELGLVEKQK